jgi:hypothetical protein
MELRLGREMLKSASTSQILLIWHAVALAFASCPPLAVACARMSPPFLDCPQPTLELQHIDAKHGMLGMGLFCDSAPGGYESFFPIIHDKTIQSLYSCATTVDGIVVHR